MVKKIGFLVGSLRKDSYSQLVADTLNQLLPEGLVGEMIFIGDLPFYNEDLETDTPPAAWVRFRQEISHLDGVIFVTPEYNRSVPAVLKNAIDVGSRPYGFNCWDKKPGAVVSQSIGAISGFGANHHLRQSLVFVNMPILPQPEVYLASIQQLLDETGKINPNTQEFLSQFLQSFAAWLNYFQ